MKVKIVKEVKRSDGLWRFACGDVFWRLPLASDKSYLVMRVKIVKEVKRSDGLWRFACGDAFYY